MDMSDGQRLSSMGINKPDLSYNDGYPMCGRYNNYNISFDLMDETFGGDNPEEALRFSSHLAIYILYNTIFLAAILGNILFCYVIFNSLEKRTVTNYLIANLAFCDLAMAIFCVPFSYIPVLKQYWPFGRLMCLLLSPAQAVCVFVSAYTLVTLAADRYMAILYPLKPILGQSQAVIVILVVWAVAILTATPIALKTTMCTDPLSGKPHCKEVS